ncbi:MAG: NusG domain II-containing protein [Oscillospiraceae bacterium]
MDKARLKLKKGDALAVAFVLFLALGLGTLLALKAAKTENPVASVYQDGKLLHSIALQEVTEREIIKVGGAFHNEIAVEPGRICVLSSDCPGEDCVHSGWIESPGRSLVCLPNRLEIRIEGGASQVDGVAR